MRTMCFIRDDCLGNSTATGSKENNNNNNMTVLLVMMMRMVIVMAPMMMMATIAVVLEIMLVHNGCGDWMRQKKTLPTYHSVLVVR